MAPTCPPPEIPVRVLIADGWDGPGSVPREDDRPGRAFARRGRAHAEKLAGQVRLMAPAASVAFFAATTGRRLGHRLAELAEHVEAAELRPQVILLAWGCRRSSEADRRTLERLVGLVSCVVAAHHPDLSFPGGADAPAGVLRVGGRETPLADLVVPGLSPSLAAATVAGLRAAELGPPPQAAAPASPARRP